MEDSIRAREREHEARVAKESLERSERFIRSALDALTTRVAVLDGTGRVIAVNAVWQRSSGIGSWLGAGCGVGGNYLAACEASALPEATEICRAIRAVLAGERERFVQQYACRDSDGTSWFTAGAARLEGAEPVARRGDS